MGGLIGGPSTISTEAPKVSGLRIQTSAIGKAIPIVYGTARIAPNIIWYDDFIAIPITTTSGGGGKGGGGVQQSNTTYAYFASIIFGMCEGVVVDINQVIKDKKILSPAQTGLTVFTGTQSQAAWGYLSTYHPDKAIPYSGTAYAAASSFNLADTGQLSNMSFEIHGLFSSTTDANPASIIYDFLTNSQYGAGFNPSRIGDLTNYSNYCTDYGLYLSPAFEAQQSAAEHLKIIMRATNSEFVWSEGLLKIIPYGDKSKTHYIANVTPIYDLTDDDFCDKTEPIKATRSTPADAFNQVQIEYYNRDNLYNPETSDVKDLANIELFGLRPSQVEQLHCICNSNTAKMAAQLILQRTLYVRNTFEFKLSWKYCLLEPMDIVTITDSALGLDKFPVRIKSVEEDEDGILTIIAEEYPFGVSTATLYPKQSPSATQINYGISPSNANAPIIFEAPDTLVTSGKGLEVWICVSGSVNWGGAEIWVSNDNSSYSFLATATSPCRTGNITLDSSTTMDIDLTESNGSLTSVTAADAVALSTLSYADGELMAYSTATLTGTHKYQLGGLVRGAYGTSNTTHLANTRWARLDNSVIKMPFTLDKVGSTIYFKILSYNQYGTSRQNLADVGYSQYKILGSALISPLPNLTGVVAFFSNSQSAISWDTVSDFRSPIDYEIRQGSTWEKGLIVSRQNSAPFIAGASGTYWIAAHYTTPSGQNVYSSVPSSVLISNAAIVQNVVATWDEYATGWSGTFGGSAYIDEFGFVALSGTALVDSLADWDSLPSVDQAGGVATSGSYTIPTLHEIDLGNAQSCKCSLSYSLSGRSVSALWDDIYDFDAYGNIDGDNAGLYGAKFQIALAQNDGVYGAWQDFIAGDYIARKFKIQVLLYSYDTSITPELSAFIFTVDVPDRVDKGTGVSIAASGTPITYTHPFQITPNVQITVVNATAGDDVVLTGESASGFTVQVLNGGVGVIRTINWISQGY